MRINNIVVVGCGGIGSYLIPPLSRVCLYAIKPKPVLHLMDGDTVEEKNLARQQFSAEDVGENKAAAMSRIAEGDLGQVKVIAEYLHDGMELPNKSVVFVCVDNHAARKAALTIADRQRLPVIIAANEVNSAQAMMYFPEWRGTGRDYRVMFPDVMTDTSDDPITAGAGCATHATLVRTGGQTAIANFMAAAYALQMFQAHFIEGAKIDEEFKDSLPIMIQSNFSSIKTTQIKETKI